MPEPIAKPALSIVVPVYMSGRVAPQLLTEIAVAFGNTLSYEVILVDDASPDDTWPRLQELRATHPELKLARMGQNRGQAVAWALGSMLARADVAMCVDDDLQYRAPAMRQLYQHFVAGGYTGCYALPHQRTGHWSARLGSWALAWLSPLLGIKAPWPRSAWPASLKVLNLARLRPLVPPEHLPYLDRALFRQLHTEIGYVWVDKSAKGQVLSRYRFGGRLRFLGQLLYLWYWPAKAGQHGAWQHWLAETQP